jgi:hypothetical protein
MRLFAFALLLAACSEEHSGARSPPEDSGGADPARDATVAVADAPAHDGNAEADAASAQASAAEGTESMAAGCLLQDVEIRGTSPYGPLRITQLGVSYWGGFTDGTGLFARGTAAGNGFELSVSVSTLWTGSSRSACPVGTYALRDGVSENNALSVEARTSAGPQPIQNAQLRVDRHDVPVPEVLKAGTPIRFEGAFTISEPGWSLELPFMIRRACSFDVDV